MTRPAPLVRARARSEARSSLVITSSLVVTPRPLESGLVTTRDESRLDVTTGSGRPRRRSTRASATRRTDARARREREATRCAPTRRRGDRLTADVVADAERRYNPLGEYEIDLRGLRIGRLENLATARDQYDAYDFTDNDVVRLENLPSMPRCKTLMFGNNRIARVNGEELARATPALTTLTLTNNALRNLGDCDAVGGAEEVEDADVVWESGVREGKLSVVRDLQVQGVEDAGFSKGARERTRGGGEDVRGG